jgi:hypothetical protein
MILAPSDALLARLADIFPSFTAELAREIEEEMHAQGGSVPGKPSAHAVYILLFDFLQSAQVTNDQLRKFSSLINDAVAEGGLAENAVSTCFLEHLHSSPWGKPLWPLLSPASKARSLP